MEHYERRHSKLGPIYKERVVPGFSNYVVVCSSPEDNEKLLRYESKMPLRVGIAQGSFKKSREDLKMPVGVAEAKGQEWLKLRTITNKHFLRHSSVWHFTQRQMEVAIELTDYVQKNLDAEHQLPDLERALKLWAFEESGLFNFDTRLGLLQDELSDEGNVLMNAMSKLFDLMAILTTAPPLWKFFETKEYKELKEAQLVLINTARKFREKNQLNFANAKSENTGLAQFLSSTELTNSEKDVIVNDFLIGGIDTTAYSAFFPLYLLATNPEKQETLRSELSKLDLDQITGKKIEQLPYLHAFFREVQRMFPFSPFFARIADKDIELSNYHIPAGTEILSTSNFINNRKAEYFEDPDQFIPERWLDPNLRQKFKFLLSGSFGQGARTCLGKRFAMQELNCLMIALLRRFRIEYHGAPLEMRFRNLAVPSENIRLSFFPIN